MNTVIKSKSMIRQFRFLYLGHVTLPVRGVLKKGVRTIAPQENFPPVRVRVWIRIRVRIRDGDNFPQGQFPRTIKKACCS